MYAIGEVLCAMKLHVQSLYFNSLGVEVLLHKVGWRMGISLLEVGGIVLLAIAALLIFQILCRFLIILWWS